jgi:GWxTD domain-containing protein
MSLSLHNARTHALLICFTLLFASSFVHASDPSKNLPAQYRHWVNEEVPYIITSEERRQFLALTSDAERDNFIKAFWDARNPDPSSGMNEYENDYYSRLAYVNEHFGNIKAEDGWRSDQGRIYLTLGPPQQKASYPDSRNVRPMEIWFYEATNPALPTHFNIVFYKRSIGEPYTLYSPYQDGPARLVTGLEALNDQKRSLDIIKKSLGDEVARTTISLIPTEVVDLSDYTPSLSSDVLLSTIRGLSDNPLTKQLLEANRSREVVTHRILVGSEQTEFEAMTLREADGRQSLNYLLRYLEPVEALIGPLPDGKLGYSMTLETEVFTKAGKMVYVNNEKMGGVVTENGASIARKKRFAAESRLPLAPGEYRLEVTLTNDLNHVALRTSHYVVIPPLSDAGWSMSKILAFSPQPPVRDTENMAPFSAAGIRFIPRGIDTVSLHTSDQLRLIFQLWNKPVDPASLVGHKIKMTYAYGRLQAGPSPTTDSEEIDASDFDASGSLLTGHSISMAGLSPGSYRLIVTAADETSQQKAYAAMGFRIVGDSEPTDLWTAYSVSAIDGRSMAMDDYKRGLSAAAQSQQDVAISWFQRSIADDAQYLPALTRLVELLSEGGRYKDVAGLSKKYPVTQQISQETAILMAQADAENGDHALALQVLQSELQFRAPNVDLYLALAKAYQSLGDSTKSNEYKQRAASLKN